jgi:hypothetical protein
MLRYSHFFVFLAILVLIAGCATAPRKGGPGEKVRTFIKDLETRNYQSLWSSLSEKTREHLQKEKGGFQNFEKSLGELMADDGNREELKKTEIVNEETKDAEASVTVKFPASEKAGKERFKQFTLSLENGEWKIEKLASVEK